jgi:NTP pyrophosphatase (non-canonical NTP hydrolase)
VQDASLEDLRARLRAFVDAREWDQFHNPKNLAMAVVVEAAELVEEFQWLTFEESEQITADKREAVEMEVADVLLLLLRLCDRLGIDPIDAARRKLVRNEVKYPVEKSRGRSTKYDKL